MKIVNCFLGQVHIHLCNFTLLGDFVVCCQQSWLGKYNWMKHIKIFYILPIIEKRQFKDYNKIQVLLQQNILVGARNWCYFTSNMTWLLQLKRNSSFIFLANKAKIKLLSYIIIVVWYTKRCKFIYRKICFSWSLLTEYIICFFIWDLIFIDN